jgi:hypothetical protein
MSARVWVRVGQTVLVLVFAAGMTVGFIADWRSALTLLFSFAYAAIGLLLTTRQPTNPIGWLFLAVGATSGLIAGTGAAMLFAVNSGQPGAGYAMASAWAANFLWVDDLTMALILTLLLFPHGLLSRRWRPVLWLTIGAATALTVLAAFTPTLTVGGNKVDVPEHNYPNPLHRGAWGFVANDTWVALLTVLALCGVLALISTVLRFRRTSGVERLQMRWFTFSGVILIVSSFSNNDYVFAVAASLVPVSCGVAILRYHLYDLDRIISRTTSYAIVTGLLVATFAVIVAVSSSLLGSKNQLGVAVATLVAAALARPALRRVQNVVDRRFDRARYDGQRTVNDFAGQLSHEVDVAAVRGALLRTVHSSLAPQQVDLWMREPV